MACHGGFALDEKTRREWYNPEQILRDIGLKENMVFMDIGCGPGFFTLLAAQTVGEKGVVYAVDADAKAIEKLKAQSQEKGLTNIRAKAAPAEETVFCTACADIVFYSMALHDFHDPLKVLENARKMVKPTGILANVDWKKTPMKFGPPDCIRFSEEKASDLMEKAGFSVQSVRDVGKHHYLVVGKP